MHRTASASPPARPAHRTAPPRRWRRLTALGALLAACGAQAPAPEEPASPADPATVEAAPAALQDGRALACDRDNGGLQLPPGFCAFVVAQNVGRARQLVVRRNGDLYVAVNPARDGSDPGRLIALRDEDGDGRADRVETLASVGGNGIALDPSQLALYLAQPDRVVRYLLWPSRLRPIAGPEVIVSGLPAVGDHNAKTIVLDPLGTSFFLNIGSASNACQVQNRVPSSPGVSPCPELAVRAGIWLFPTLRSGQRQADGVRFATGLRNTNALALQPGTGALYGAVNGRDQLFENWPDRFTEADDREAPAEEVLRIRAGADNGWPYCYEDPRLGYKVLAPEYGGDGRARGGCGAVPPASLTLPAHWAPLSMLFYTGGQFPADYRGDAFIANHGTRFPGPAAGPGYNVVRVRFEGGRPTRWETFADGFAGGAMTPAGARDRAVGLAQGPDGSLYITSDQLPGRIWRVIYKGP